MLLNPTKFPNSDESLENFKQETNKSLDKFRIADQAMLANYEARLGRPMTHVDMVNRIVKLARHSIWAEESWAWAGGMNFYTMKGKEKVCLGTPFEKGFLPEYTVVHPDQENLPGSRTVGWREVLSRLITQKILKLKDVEKAFGLPTSTPSTRWQQQIRNFR